jgi:outer membrane protein OmpA-like peptidoglycan-associated protein
MKNTILISLSLIASIGFAQTNLVPNSTFEKTDKKKVKVKGQIALANPWTSPTLVQSDLYVTKTKIFEIGIPANSYGEEKPMEGSGYAGITAYSYKGKIPRSYLQVQLTEVLEEGKEYCVKFHVSLADLSKYACDNLGISLSNEAMTANNSDVLKFDSYIVSRRLTIYEAQYDWAPICGIYKAKGGEEYITIGNFMPDEKLKTKKVKRPRGFTKPQKNTAYYYIDNVSVITLEDAGKCDCDVIPGMENAETVKRDFNSDENVNTTTIKIINTDGSSVTSGAKGENSSTSTNSATSNSDDNIDGMMVEFDSKSYAMNPEAISKTDKIVAYMKANNKSKIILTGYIDASESDVEKLDGRRVGAIYKYIVSKGIAKEKITRELGGDYAINEKQKTKNMRVEVTLNDASD